MPDSRDVQFQDTKERGEDESSRTAQYRIIYYGADFTLEVLNSKLKSMEISIPKFQRRFIWPIKRSSRLIESFLLGLPVPQIFLYREEKTQDLLVVDGHQRLKSIEYFLSETFEDGRPFRLVGVKPTWEGKKFTELTSAEQRYLKNSVLRSTIFEQTDPKDKTSMFEIFNRLNTGGIPLSNQEIRNCINGGEFNEMLKELNTYDNWRSLLRANEPDKRMRDVEVILRFFALRDRWRKYNRSSQSLRDFMTEYMSDHRNLGEKERALFCESFKKIVEVIHNEIGPKALQVKGGGVNVAVFDSIAVALSEIGPDKVKDLKMKYDLLIKKEAYIEDVSSSTADTDKLHGRINIAIGTFQ